MCCEVNHINNNSESLIIFNDIRYAHSKFTIVIFVLHKQHLGVHVVIEGSGIYA